MGMRFATYAWSVLAYNIGVILWGAYVRATGSGAGCGSHWPLCNGQVIPRDPTLQTWIEYAHRSTSGVALILVVAMGVWARRAFAPGHRVRKAATASVVLIFIEALIGAGLVLLELVAHDPSMRRVVSIVLHLVNTMLLLGALTLVARWAETSSPARSHSANPAGEQGAAIVPSASELLGAVSRSGWAIVAGFLLVGATGAVTALGDTLIQQGSVDSGYFLIRLRVYHPILAVGFAAAAIVWLMGEAVKELALKPWALRAASLLALNVGLGVVNVLLQAPVWMQLVHLLVADACWIALVLFLSESAYLLANSRMYSASAAQPSSGNAL